jgi:hypothetical protein
MLPAPDGGWTLDVPSAGPLAYALNLTTPGGTQRVPNPGEPAVEFRKGAFYSIATPIAGLARIRLDPRLLPNGSGHERGAVTFPNAEVHNQLFELADSFRSDAANLVALLRGPESDRKKVTAFRTERGHAYLATFSDSSRPRLVRQLAGALSIAIDSSVNKTQVQSVLKVAGPECAVWAFVPPTIEGLTAYELGSPAETREFLRAMSKVAFDRRLRASAGLFLAREMVAEGDSESSRSALRQIAIEFSDLPDVMQQVVPTPGSRTLTPGVALPEYSFRTLDGTTVSSGAASGRNTLLVFSAFGCGACRAVDASLSTLRSTVAENRLVMITATLGLNDNGLKAVLPKAVTPWHQVALGDDPGDVLRRYDVHYFPTIYLVGPDGLIVATDQELSKGDLVSSVVSLLAPKSKH